MSRSETSPDIDTIEVIYERLGMTAVEYSQQANGNRERYKMAPLLDDKHDNSVASQVEPAALVKPRFLIIGAGHRGTAYARAVTESGLGVISAIAEPQAFKRERLGRRYVWQDSNPAVEQSFEGWADFIAYEQQRRSDAAAGKPVAEGVDGVFVCVQDQLHVTVVTALAPLSLHIMCEKPLATSLDDCLRIRRALTQYPPKVFAIGHVLRYSPHNMLLRHLLLEKKVIGDILSIEHTEPVGWWHFSHSYVRGLWRKEKISAPSLLAKSCHDIDLILWMLATPSPDRLAVDKPHLPSSLTSAGSLRLFRQANKPKAARDATNCLSCPLQDSCMFSAKRIYFDRHLAQGKTLWPVDVVNPTIGHIFDTEGPEKAKEVLMNSLAEDYTVGKTPVADIESRPWFGRCVWEADNNVCDDQTVTMEWDENPGVPGQGPKTAIFHMVAQTLSQCERRGRVYGTLGEVSYDSNTITVHDFPNDATRAYRPEVPKNSHHGGGDDGLSQQFVRAVASVKEGRLDAHAAELEFLGCTLEDVIRSHAAVFAAEEARLEKKVVDWNEWWHRRVDSLDASTR